MFEISANMNEIYIILVIFNTWMQEMPFSCLGNLSFLFEYGGKKSSLPLFGYKSKYGRFFFTCWSNQKPNQKGWQSAVLVPPLSILRIFFQWKTKQEQSERWSFSLSGVPHLQISPSSEEFPHSLSLSTHPKATQVLRHFNMPSTHTSDYWMVHLLFNCKFKESS